MSGIMRAGRMYSWASKAANSLSVIWSSMEKCVPGILCRFTRKRRTWSGSLARLLAAPLIHSKTHLLTWTLNSGESHCARWTATRGCTHVPCMSGFPPLTD